MLIKYILRKKQFRFSLFELVGVKMKHTLYLFIATTLFSKIQQTIHQLIVLCQSFNFEKKLFIHKK